MRIKACNRYYDKKTKKQKTLKHEWVLKGTWQVCIHCDHRIVATKKFFKDLCTWDTLSKTFRRN